MSLHHRLIRNMLPLLLVALLPDITFAGWMGFRNDTSVTLLVQETVKVNDKPLLGRVQKLIFGESVRDNSKVEHTEREFSIYDSRNPKTPLLIQKFSCPRPDENVIYALSLDAAGKLEWKAISSPVPK